MAVPRDTLVYWNKKGTPLTKEQTTNHFFPSMDVKSQMSMDLVYAWLKDNKFVTESDCFMLFLSRAEKLFTKIGHFSPLSVLDTFKKRPEKELTTTVILNVVSPNNKSSSYRANLETVLGYLKNDHLLEYNDSKWYLSELGEEFFKDFQSDVEVSQSPGKVDGKKTAETAKVKEVSSDDEFFPPSLKQAKID